MTAVNDRIEGLIQLVTKALDEPAPSPELAAIKEQIAALPERSQRRLAVMIKLMSLADVARDELAAQARIDNDPDILAARRWARQAGLTARAKG